MGIADLFGIRIIKLELKGNIQTMEELFEQIKDLSFEAGKPELVRHGIANIIAFPKLDQNNQVQILGSKGHFTVNRSVQPAGLSNIVMNDIMNEVTDGWSSMSGAMGNVKKRCLAHVTNVAETIHNAGI